MEARSIDISQLTFDGNTCILPNEASPQFVNPKGTSLLFLYSVEWKQSDVSWASRWDVYLGMSDVEIHWFSIINSLIVVFFLSGENAIIMIVSFWKKGKKKFLGMFHLIHIKMHCYSSDA